MANLISHSDQSKINSYHATLFSGAMVVEIRVNTQKYQN